MSDVVWPKGTLDQWKQLIQRAQAMDKFDPALDPEIQTDKHLVKVLPCQYCKRPLVVTTFYVLAWAKCGPCKGDAAGPREPGSMEVVQAGRTDPRLAADLTKVLINPHFAKALCPVHPDDDEHEMELKSVHHNDNYGPHELRFQDGKPVMVQVEDGEVVMHQCRKCLAVVTYSTAVVTPFRRVNEGPRNIKHSEGWGRTLGSREDDD